MLAEADTTENAALGGRLMLRQPKRGHRFGHDTILLAAAVDAAAIETAADFGAGVGAAGLALARRVPGLKVSLIEIDPMLADLARQNAARNGLADRVSVAAIDVAASGQAFAPESFAHVLMNPPFNDPARQNVSPDPLRLLAHAAASGTLVKWIARASALLVPSGTVTLIWRADGLADVLDSLPGFGGVAIRPLHPKPGAAAIRILVRAVKGSGAPLSILPGLTLNSEDGRPSAEAEAILRGAAPLPMTA
jgi:tRNA1(Val) A37 N6-methylase TrmN6